MELGRCHEKKILKECGVFEKWNAHSLFSEIFLSLFFETSCNSYRKGVKKKKKKKKKKNSW